MGDPLSATGSIIAVFALAAQSCEVLCKFIRSFNEATEDLEHHIATLQALKSTFARISELEQDSTNSEWVRQLLSSRLQECLLELKAMEEFVKPLYDELRNGKARRTWIKTKWAGANQKQKVERFMARIESYYMTFSLELLLINTSVRPQSTSQSNGWNPNLQADSRLALQSPRQLVSGKELIVCPLESAQREAQTFTNRVHQFPMRLIQGSCSSSEIDDNNDTANTIKHCCLLSKELQEVPCGASDQLSTLGADQTLENEIGPPKHVKSGLKPAKGAGIDSGSKGSTSALPFRLEAASFHSIFIRNSENPFLPFSWSLSQIDRSRATKGLKTSPEAARIYQGYCFGLTMTMPWGFALGFEILMYFWRKASEPSLSFSSEYRLSFPSVVSWDTRSVRSTMCGDVDAIKAEFGNRGASPFDVMPDGSTLLHVSQWKLQLGFMSV